MDVAVQSRIHLAIQYQDLTKEQKQNIFRNFLDQIDQSKIKNRRAIDVQLEKLCKKNSLNGRQIRNIVTSAQALAASQKERLSFDHLEKVLDMTMNFVESMKDLTNSKRKLHEAPNLF